MRKINNLQDLRLAKAETRMKRDKVSAELNSRISFVKDYYSPSGIVNRVMDKVAPVIDVAGIAVDIYDRIHSSIVKRRERKAQAKAQAHAQTSGELEENNQFAD